MLFRSLWFIPLLLHQQQNLKRRSLLPQKTSPLSNIRHSALLASHPRHHSQTSIPYPVFPNELLSILLPLLQKYLLKFPLNENTPISWRKLNVSNVKKSDISCLIALNTTANYVGIKGIILQCVLTSLLISLLMIFLTTTIMMTITMMKLGPIPPVNQLEIINQPSILITHQIKNFFHSYLFDFIMTNFDFFHYFGIVALVIISLYIIYCLMPWGRYRLNCVQ